MGVYKGIIFDLDETLINTSSLKQYRDLRNWKSCYDNVHLTKHYPDGREIIDYLKKNEFKIGIVTNSPRNYAQTVLNHHQIRHDSLVGYHDCDFKKPHPGPINLCISKLGLPKELILGVGDDIKDIKAYKNAGMYAIGVTWGVHSEIELQSVGADKIISSFNELLSII